MTSRSLTVAVLANTIFPGGGLMQFLKHSLIAMAQEKPEWRFVVIASISQDFLKDIHLPGIEVVYWDNAPKYRLALSAAIKMLSWMKKSADAGFLLQSRSEQYGLPWGDIDLVHNLLSQCDLVWVPHYNIDLERLSMKKLLGKEDIPQLFTIHDIHPAFFPEDHVTGNLVRFYKGFTTYSESCSAIITHSEYQKQKIVEQIGISPDKVTVTPQPPLIDPVFLLQKFTFEEKQKICVEMGINKTFAFYPASTLHVHKNHSRLLVAWSMLKENLGDQCPQLVFTSKGNRKQWHRIATLIHELGIEEEVVFTGQVTNKQLAVLFQSCLFVALPTLYEGSGSGVLTDAYVIGKRVLCSQIPQIEEQLKILPGADVNFFDGNSVLSIFDTIDYELNSAKGNIDLPEMKRNTVISERFSQLWHEFAKCYSDIMEQVAEGNPAASPG